MGGFGGPPTEPQSMQAELFGGHSKEYGWEPIINGVYLASAVIFVMIANAPDTNIKTWAAGEARRRLDLVEKGEIEKAEFGVHYDTDLRYAKYDFEMKKIDNPFDEEEDDDDEEEEDDDDEEDEEEGEGDDDDEDDEEED